MKKTGLAILAALTLWLTTVPAQAGDPFRRKPPRPIDSQTEQVFEQVFIYGNYPQARNILTELLTKNPKEPLVYALAASMAYLDGDLTTMGQFAAQTMKTAEALQAIDPLRGHLYVGVAHFLEGG